MSAKASERAAVATAKARSDRRRVFASRRLSPLAYITLFWLGYAPITLVYGPLDDPTVKGRLAEWGATALGGSPSDFGKFVADETEKWGRVIRAANIKAE
jgi:hypothetical protein